MLLYLFFDSLLSNTCPKKMATDKWPMAADSPLLCLMPAFFFTKMYYVNSFIAILVTNLTTFYNFKIIN